MINKDFLYKTGKTSQFQDGAPENVFSRYVKRPIQRNYTSHLSIPPNYQCSQLNNSRGHKKSDQTINLQNNESAGAQCQRLKL